MPRVQTATAIALTAEEFALLSNEELIARFGENLEGIPDYQFTANSDSAELADFIASLPVVEADESETNEAGLKSAYYAIIGVTPDETESDFEAELLALCDTIAAE
jgi:hypothetical protein